MSLPREFASDNTAPVHPAVLEALAAANHGPSPAYGADPWTARARDWFREQFGAVTSAAFVLAMLADFTILPAAMWLLFRERPDARQG